MCGRLGDGCGKSEYKFSDPTGRQIQSGEDGRQPGGSVKWCPQNHVSIGLRGDQVEVLGSRAKRDSIFSRIADVRL